MMGYDGKPIGLFNESLVNMDSYDYQWYSDFS